MSRIHCFAVISLLAGAISAAAFSTGFGVQGRTGYPGEDGRNGRPGVSTRITATGQPVSLNLSGEFGTDARDGRDGENAYDCRQPQAAADDLYGAEGGWGGNGGNGGSGGDAGDVEIYTDNLNNLRQVLVVADPGRAGRPGRPGYGGRGCACTVRTWVIKKCEQANGTDVCKDYSYSCHDGERGRPGQAGTMGREGRRGSIVVIPQLQPLSGVQPTAHLTMNQLLSGPFTLSDNIWSTKYGASQILAYGSRVNDMYRQFERRQEGRIAFRWNDSRPLSDFARSRVDLAMSADGTRINFAVDPNVWFDGSESMIGGVQTVTFQKVIFKSEAENLRLTVSGAMSGLVAQLDDLASMSSTVQTSIYVSLKKDGFFSDKTIYEGPMPAALLQASGNQFIMKLGAIPGIDLTQLKHGNKVIVKLSVTRTFAGYNLVKDLEVKYRIP